VDRGNKKRDERLVLDLIYSHFQGLIVEDGESPDFVLRRSEEDEPFGVEISRLYGSELQARLERVPGYTDHLLDGGSPRHRHDKKSVGTIILMQPDGEVVEAGIPAICEASLTFWDYSKLLSDRITSKDLVLARQPRIALRHVNLVLLDHTRRLTQIQPDQFFQKCGNKELRDAIYKSNFREVYLVTEFSTGPATVPLRLLTSFCRLLLVKAACAEHVAEGRPVPNALDVFGRDLASLSRLEVWQRQDCDGSETLYGDCGFLLDADGGTIVRLYQDQPLPNAIRVHANEVLTPWISMEETIETMSQTRTVAVGISLPLSSERWTKALGSTA
jgi:hypothetical protein